MLQPMAAPRDSTDVSSSKWHAPPGSSPPRWIALLPGVEIGLAHVRSLRLFLALASCLNVPLLSRSAGRRIW